jgi:hypothetical protein
MREQIQKMLEPLIGMSLWSSGRAADLDWFSFGQRRTVTTANGQTKEIGEYALHVQCAWRITHGNDVVVGSSDLYHPLGERVDPIENFNWDVQGANSRDERIAELFQNETRHFLVRAVEVGNAGAFTITFDNEYALDIFPDDSLREEYWRIFKPYAEQPHFVVTGRGLKS